MNLVWEDARCSEGEARRQHARLPENIGWVNITESSITDSNGRPALRLHCRISNMPGGLPAFSGMPDLGDRYKSFEDLKAAVPEVLASAMQARIDSYERHIAGIREAMAICDMN